MDSSQKGQGVGLVGGLGVGATVYYYQAIVEACLSQGCTPNLVIAHADVEQIIAMVGAGQIEPLAQYIAGFVDTLERAGVRFAAIGAIAPHLCLPDLVARTRLPILSLLSETCREIQARGLKQVTLLGNRASIETRLFGGLDGVEVVLPSPDEISYVHETYTAIARARQATVAQTESLRELAHTLCAREKLDAVVLAGTDLSLAFNASNTDFPAVDCARVHVEAIVRELVI